MKKAIFILSIMFVFMTSVKAETTINHYVRGYANTTKIYDNFDVRNISSTFPALQNSYIRILTHFHTPIEEDIKNSMGNNYLITLTVCATDNFYGNADAGSVTNNGSFVRQYNRDVIGSCSVNGYTGVLQKIYTVITLNDYYLDLQSTEFISVVDLYLWGNVIFAGDTPVQIKGISYDLFTPEMQKQFESQINQNNIINGISGLGSAIGGLKDDNQTIINQNTEAETTRKGILATIRDMFSTIVNLPSAIVNLLVEGLKSLFVPTNEQLFTIINKSSALSEDFGFVGQSVNFFLNIFTSLMGMINADGCINLPEFKIPFSKTSLDINDVTFWSEQNVCLAHNPILNKNIDIIRTITSIALVCMFISFASRQIFGLLSKNSMGVEESVSYNQDTGAVVHQSYRRTNGKTFIYRGSS